MNYVRENIVPTSIGAILSGVGALAMSIYSDFLPGLIPVLKSIAPEIYIKISALLALLFVLAAALALVAFMKARPYRPRALAGKKFGFQWTAELDYSNKRSEVEVEVQWLCPKHGVHLGIKSAEIPETTYHTLWCMKCDKSYPMQSHGDAVHVEEVERLVRREILGKLRLE
ncbi:hypothetical protein [Rhodoferax saidenbachensis]|uniref:Uncharacterized protein n=1 Tax=Rhodoferax saidenbachensis TaxID=1484693 RepID=A0A1P8K7Y3_9BURK|nr:hypothetical protein [Rhodoferax saidenbachensis]APW42076.1 hypothetical protein RS694_05705 [Rhodoferax saidenbachensis]